ncbi:helix-turn-helix transcriptional regulator [Sporosarcina sp. FSL K6-3457]|uniref:helix-turn-helix transcriptional regulator n=1 Tax=Sporosarcina sp. FSL K6-3457 TaxID=2978204 RepID=UPI0030F566B4
MEIGQEIKKRRTELNITQEELAKRLNVTRAAISNFKLGSGKKLSRYSTSSETF